MTKADIIDEVSELTGLTKVETEAVFEGVILTISNALKRQDRIDIRGFGSFQVKKRKARDARNPATQELLRLKERYVPVFKVSNLLKEQINKNI
ncbi:MAG: integration host factor subunit beta [Candidatus Marinimicrobia bacterium]|nr:integration host factor subunit beta [Candidatus Neomarinimicrobiota bacterium]|tara:strand:- start:995 stop:1276 length:282 start_codon:yes stop_codon:yes gene_type:complete